MTPEQQKLMLDVGREAQSKVRGITESIDSEKSAKELLEPLRDKRIVFIFDECHRSQFGENHKAIKEFFPKSQLFGFTGTPIFEANASLQKIEGDAASMRTTVDLFQKQLHTYTITHAIEDGNVLRFHIDYYKPEGKNPPKPGEAIAKKAVIEAILTKHDAATASRRFKLVESLCSSLLDDIAQLPGLRALRVSITKPHPMPGLQSVRIEQWKTL